MIPVRKAKKPLERPLMLPGEAVSQLDPFNRQFFEWDEVLRLSRKRRKPSSLSV